MMPGGAGSWLSRRYMAEAKRVVADVPEPSLDLADLVMGRHYC
jgi:hypothetical protein